MDLCSEIGPDYSIHELPQPGEVFLVDLGDDGLHRVVRHAIVSRPQKGPVATSVSDLFEAFEILQHFFRNIHRTPSRYFSLTLAISWN